ncbi:MAG: single-stranded-DNA-specific exonuclease RecJ [Lachnospiraceae bacterium]|nr:single-stranded-DNA-specific exonuclease RecJ [Lachnospiraceae bacterium]
MAGWKVYAKRADFQQIAQECGISPVLARIIRNRDVIGAEETRKFLEGSLTDLRDPFLLTDMDRACALLTDKIRERRRIRVIGDYDVDGICSGYILVRTLRFYGCSADAVLPDRVLDGYGINERIVREAAAEGVDTLLTCDNGISAAEPLKLAREAGMSIIVTDHHEVPFSLREDGTKEYHLPPADAVIDPKRPALPGCAEYPFPDICGAFVALKLCDALYERSDKKPDGWERLRKELLGFAAIATVCDVMPLQDENRILVRHGLTLAQHTENVGLKALISVCGLSGRPISAYHAGFIIGPCLNASGRLSGADRALDLFFEEDGHKALHAAGELQQLNESRKEMTQRSVDAACAAVLGQKDPMDRILVVLLENCHESLAGIVAGKVRERFHRPALILTRVADGLIKGSGRSTERYNLYENLTLCADLLVKFGGHAMAAGVTLKESDLPAFRERLNAQCTLEEDQLEDDLHIDMELPLRYADAPLVRSFEKLEPFGTGNPRPLFVTREITLTGFRILGKNRNVVKFEAAVPEGGRAEVIRFGSPEEIADLTARMPVRIHLVYSPDINSYLGRESMQYIMKDYRILP